MLKHKEKKYKPHHGQILKKAIEDSGFTIRFIASKVNKEYSTLFKWFDKEELDLGVFLKVGKVINKDFSNEVPEINHLVNEDPVPYNTIDLAQCLKENDRLRTQYTKLLERHNALLEKTSAAK